MNLPMVLFGSRLVLLSEMALRGQACIRTRELRRVGALITRACIGTSLPADPRVPVQIELSVRTSGRKWFGLFGGVAERQVTCAHAVGDYEVGNHVHSYKKRGNQYRAREADSRSRRGTRSHCQLDPLPLIIGYDNRPHAE